MQRKNKGQKTGSPWGVVLAAAALVLCGLRAEADNVVTVNSVTIRPGSTAELVVSLESDEDFSVYAYDFRLYLPDGISVAQNDLGAYRYELKTRNASHAANVLETTDSGIQFGISSPTLALTGHEGEVLGITLQADAALAEGIYEASIRQATYANKEAQTVHPADITFSVEVKNMVTLDENSTTMPEEATGVSALVRRTIKAGEWSTICLPFDMSEEQAKEAFGSDVRLADFNGYEVEEDDGGDIVGITVKFNDATAIEANHPYIIKVSADIGEFSVDGVDILPEEEPTVAAVKRTRKQWSEMIGTYVADTQVPENTLFLSGNQFWYSTGETRIKAFRGYFDFYDVLTSVENAANITVLVGDEATAIGNIATDRTRLEGEVYTVNGQLVGRDIPARKMQKGIYIAGGKKVVIK